MEKVRSFEETAKQDTFDDLYAKIEPLVDEAKYDEARAKIYEELHLLAESLSGSADEQFDTIKKEFVAFLPEDVRGLLDVKADAESDDEIVANMEKDGWNLVRIVPDLSEADIKDTPEKERKAIGRGKRTLIFERKKSDFHGDYSYE